MESCQTEAEAFQQNQEPENPVPPQAYQEEWEPESSPEEGEDAYQEYQEPESPGQGEAYQESESSTEEEPQVIFVIYTVKILIFSS